LFTIEKYSDKYRDDWNALVFNSHAPFLFNRDFLEHHIDKYKELSLVIFYKDEFIGIFPASFNDNRIFSHGYLTYGGLTLRRELKTNRVIEVFKLIENKYKSLGFRFIELKLLPSFYRVTCSQSQEFALHYLGWSLIGRGLSSGLNLTQSSFSKKKARDCKRGYAFQMNNGSDSLEEIFTLINSGLKKKYSASAAHSAKDINNLQKIFPNNIKVFELRDQEKNLLSAAIIFLSNQVAHIQYMTLSEIGRGYRALDSLIYQIYELYRDRYEWLEFGVSTTNYGKNFNETLATKKEEYGATPLCYDIYLKQLT